MRGAYKTDDATIVYNSSETTTNVKELYLSLKNETSNYACRQTLNMYDKVCTNRLLSVAVCTWQLFSPYAAVVKTKEEEVRSDLEL